MNVTREVTTAALIQDVLIYQVNTDVFARLDGSGMATIVQMSTNANSTGILAAQMKTAKTRKAITLVPASLDGAKRGTQRQQHWKDAPSI